MNDRAIARCRPIPLEAWVTSPQRKIRMPQLAPAQMLNQALSWRRTFEHPFPVDAWDPVARLVRDRLSWDWPQVWLAAFLVYGLLEKLIMPALGGYLVLCFGGLVWAPPGVSCTGVRDWRPDIEALLTGFVEFPFFLAFYIWTSRGIGNLFSSLARNRSFRDEQRYAQFMDRAAASFDRWWWTALSGLLGLLTVGLMQFVVWAPGTNFSPWFERGGAFPRVISLILIGCVASAVATIVVREIITLVWLQRLWTELGDDLQVRPYHADRAGGLGAIGQHAIAFASFVLMLALFIVMATLLPSLRMPDAAIGIWSPAIALIWILYVCIVPTIYFVLIWPPHHVMQRVRAARINRVANQIDQQLEGIEQTAASGQGELGEPLKNIEQLKSVYTILKDDLPAWPINARIRRQLSLSALLPIGYSLLTLALDWFGPR